MANELIPASQPDYPMSGMGEESMPSSSPNRLGRFLACLKKFWWIPLLTVAAGTAGGVYLSSRTVPVYESSARMWETIKVRLPDESLYSDDMENLLGTQIELLQSDKMRQLALDRMASMTNGTGSVSSGAGDASGVLIRVNVIPKSSIFEVEAIGSNPTFTQNFLDALMQSFLDYDRNMRNSISGMTLASITDQMQSLEQDLKSEQDALMDYEKTNNLGILQEEESVAGGYLEKLQTQLSDLQLEAKLLDTAQKDNQQAVAGGTNAVIPYSVLSALEPSSSSGASAQPGVKSTDTTDLELMKMERAELAKYLQPQSPKITELDTEIKQAEDVEAIKLRQTSAQLATYIQANQIKTQYVEDSIKEWQAKVAEANTRLSEADHLKLNIQRTQSAYDRLTSLSENLGISRSIDQGSLAILESASPPLRSHQAERRKLGMAIFGGLVSGLGLVFLMSLKDDRFTSLGEVNSMLGDSVVGMLPKVAQEKGGIPQLLQPNDPRHIYAESYRSLRSALRFLETDEHRPRILLITSATPNEGKSTVSANLARTLAMAGLRVLLVDGDLRRGHLHQLLGLENNGGLTGLLSGTSELDKVIQTNCMPNLSFISRGNNNDNPGDLLLSSRLDEFLRQWRNEYDYVLLDSSPVFATADAGALAPRVDGTLFLVRSHHSSARVTREALEMLVQRRARIIGVVFNMAETAGHSGHYYQYAEYYPTAKPD